MRKSCLKSANDEDAHPSMHPVHTVGSVHATYKNIENELSHTWPKHSKDKVKCPNLCFILDKGSQKDPQNCRYINIMHAWIQKVLSEGGPTLTCFLVGKYHFKRAIIGLPAKRHFAGVSIKLNAGLVALWFFKISVCFSVKNMSTSIC